MIKTAFQLKLEEDIKKKKDKMNMILNKEIKKDNLKEMLLIAECKGVVNLFDAFDILTGDHSSKLFMESVSDSSRDVINKAREKIKNLLFNIIDNLTLIMKVVNDKKEIYKLGDNKDVKEIMKLIKSKLPKKNVEYLIQSKMWGDGRSHEEDNSKKTKMDEVHDLIQNRVFTAAGKWEIGDMYKNYGNKVLSIFIESIHTTDLIDILKEMNINSTYPISDSKISLLLKANDKVLDEIEKIGRWIENQSLDLSDYTTNEELMKNIREVTKVSITKKESINVILDKLLHEHPDILMTDKVDMTYKGIGNIMGVSPDALADLHAIKKILDNFITLKKNTDRYKVPVLESYGDDEKKLVVLHRNILDLLIHINNIVISDYNTVMTIIGILEGFKFALFEEILLSYNMYIPTKLKDKKDIKSEMQKVSSKGVFGHNTVEQIMKKTQDLSDNQKSKIIKGRN